MPDKFPVYAIDAYSTRSTLVAHILENWTPVADGAEGWPFCHSRVRRWIIVEEKDFIADSGVSHVCKRCQAAYRKSKE